MEFTHAFCVTSNTPRKSLVFSLFDIFVFWTHRRSNDIYTFKFSPEERHCLFFLNLSRRKTAKYIKTRGNRTQKNMTNVSQHTGLPQNLLHLLQIFLSLGASCRSCGRENFTALTGVSSSLGVIRSMFIVGLGSFTV